MMRLDADAVTAVIDGHTIVSRASLQVDDGEMVGLVGPNGSGKSTLLRCIYRALRPYAGTVTVDGDDVWRLSARAAARRTAVVVQEPASDFDFAVRDVVTMGRTPHLGLLDRPSARDEDLIDRSLIQVGAAHLADRRFASLSGGEKQRVLLARALAQQPRLLVLDEPTNHLDVGHQLDVLELVRAQATATLAALHDLNLAAAYCDRVYVLRAGEIIAAGAPDQVLTPELIEAVFEVGAVRTDHPTTGTPQLFFHPLDPTGTQARPTPLTGRNTR